MINLINLDELKFKSFKIIKKRFNLNLRRAYGRSISHKIIDGFKYDLNVAYGKYEKEPFEGPYDSVWYSDVFKECNAKDASYIRIHIALQDIRGFVEINKSEIDNIDKISEKIANYAMIALINEME